MSTHALRASSNTLVLFARTALTSVLSLVTTRLTISALGVDDFGIMALVTSVVSLLMLINTGLLTSTQRFLANAESLTPPERTQAFTVAMLCQLAGVVLFVAVGLGCTSWIFDSWIVVPPGRALEARHAYQIMVVAFAVLTMSYPYDAAINVKEEMFVYAVIGLVEAVGKACAAALLYKMHGDKLVWFSIMLLVVNVVVVLARAGYCRTRYLDYRVKLHGGMSALIKEFGAHAGWTTLGNSTSMVAGYGQAIVLNSFFGTRINAAQGVSAQLSGQLGVLSQNLIRAINPIIQKNWASDRPLMLKVTNTGTKLGFALLLFLYVPFLLETDIILKAWLGIVPEFATPFIRLSLARNLIEQLYLLMLTGISAAGNIGRYQTVVSCINLIPLLVSFVLFRLGFPPPALYWTFLLYAVTMLGIVFQFSRATFGLEVNTFATEILLRPAVTLIVTMGVAAVSVLAFEPGVVRVFVTTALATLTWIVAVYTILLSAGERRTLTAEFERRLTAWRSRRLGAKAG